jgi:oligoribonuclease
MEIMMAETSSSTNQNNLIWLDMEMSGLLPDSDRILELAAVVTDADLNVLGESPVLVIHQSDAVLDGMDAWNKGAHGRSGLIEKVKASTLDEAEATAQMIAFLKQFVPANKSPMCGNSICQDRRFMARYNLDVSVFKELARRWKPEIYSGFKKASKHEALADIYESIDELKYYREHFIVK